MKIENLSSLLVHTLHELRDFEQASADALNTIGKTAQSTGLSAALKEQAAQATAHASKLEKVCDLLNASKEGHKSQSAAATAADAREIAKRAAGGPAGDAAIVQACLKILACQISLYESALTFAETMEALDEYELIEECLEDKLNAREVLSDIALEEANTQALGFTQLKAVGNL